jgi:hypothetical protein
MVVGQQGSLTSPHALALLVGGVVPPEHMQDSVHHEQRELVVESSGVSVGLTRRHLGADHDIAEEKRKVAAVDGRAIGCARTT